MFRALLAHPQEALHKWHLVYCMHVMSVAATRVGVERRPVMSLVYFYLRESCRLFYFLLTTIILACVQKLRWYSPIAIAFCVCVCVFELAVKNWTFAAGVEGQRLHVLMMETQ
jgi:hypothetical protein